MTQMPVEANVVLTADNSQYDQSMSASAATTAQLARQVDSVTDKLGNLSRSAGRKMLGFSMADVASITAATVAFGAYQKQMTSLNVQAAALTRTADQQRQVFSGYASDVANLRNEFAMTTSEAAALTQSITRLSDQTAPANKLAESFAKLGAATGESSVALQQSMSQLQRTMGIPQRDTERLNNQLFVLSQRSNASAASILDFSQNIAPVGRLVNMTQTDIMGFSNAFIKAGQDGYRASNVFNRMVSDIAYATQTGSPELAKYANLVGMTAEQFKGLGGTDQILKVFDAINRQGPQAITTLNRMGYDGMQTVRTVTAMAQQGGMASEISAARNADPNALNRGNAAALDTLSHKLAEIRSQLQQTAEAFGARFAGPAGTFLDTIGHMSSVVRSFTEGPLGALAAAAAGISAPFLAVAGAVAVAARGLATFATASLLLRGSLARGFMETRAMSPEAREMMMATGSRPGIGGGRVPAGAEGARIASEGNFVARAMYNAGSAGAWYARAGFPGGASYLGRAAGWALTGAGGATRFLGQAVYSPGSSEIPGVAGTGGYDSTNNRLRFFSSPTLREAATRAYTIPRDMIAGTQWGSAFRLGVAERAMTSAGLGFYNRGQGVTMYDDAYKMNQVYDKRMTQLQGSRLSGMADPREQARTAARYAEEQVTRTSAVSQSLRALERESMSAGKGMANFGRGIGNLSMMMASTGLSVGRFAGNVGKQAYGLLGGNPLLATGLGLWAGYALDKAATADRHYTYQDQSGFSSSYYQSGGLAAPTPVSLGPQPGTTAARQVTLAQALNVSQADVAAANMSNYQLTNDRLKDVTTTQDAVAALTPDWGNLLQSPTSVNNTVMDLTNRFGAAGAREVISQLQAGGQTPFYKLGEFSGSGFADRLAHINSGSVTQSNINTVLGTVAQQAAVINANQGDLAMRQYQGQAFDQMVEAFTSGPGYDPNGSRYSEPRSVFAQAMAKQLFGVTLDDEQAKRTYIDPHTNLRGLITTMVNNPGGGYWQGLSDEQLQQALQQVGVKDTTLTGTDAINALVKALQHPREDRSDQSGPTTEDLIRRQTRSTYGPGGVLENKAVDYALNAGAEDPNAQYQAYNTVAQGLRNQYGGDFGKMLGGIQNLIAAAGTDASMGADIFSGTQAMLQQSMAYRAPYQTRTQNFAQQTDVYQALMNADIGPGSEQMHQQAAAAYQQQVMDQYNYFKQQLYQQREFDVARSRAEEDYNLQRQYAQDDFDRQRTRAEFDYHLMRHRAEADYERQVNRARTDFYLQRHRQEEDFQHQVRVMTEQTARQAMDIYTRTPVQQTSSAGWLLYNAQDQLEQMQGQEQNLRRLRQQGLSDNAIQQLGLTDPQNAQQLARFVAEVANNPEMIRQFNKQVAERLKAAGSLVTDSSSMDWQEMTRSYRLQRQRAQEDFQRQMQRGHEDFQRTLNQQDDDFARSLKRQDDDFGISMDRMADQYNKTMDRSAADLARSARTIDGNFEEILTKATNRLSGHAQKQAQSVLKEFDNLKGDTSRKAVDLMQSLADIFGVSYTPPKVGSNSSGGGGGGGGPFANFYNSGPGYGGKTSNDFFPGGSHAAGGVLPGYTPTRDVHHYHSETGGDLHLSGGEAIMVPEWTKAVGGAGAVQEMNRRARAGRFWMGGVLPLPGASSISKHETGYPSDIWAGDLNWPGRADYGKPIVAYRSGVAHPYDYHRDESYGRGVMISGAGGQSQLYAHMSAIVKGLAGQMVRAGQVIGYVGDYGNTGTPPTSHLHFELKNGGWDLPFTDHYTSGSGSGLRSGNSLRSILSQFYGGPERAAAAMGSIHPLGRGDISGIINRMARQRYHMLLSQFGRRGNSRSGNNGALAMGPEPGGNLDNQGLVRRAMQDAGWHQWPSMYDLVMSESGFSNTAQNPNSTAYGMFQFLDSTWAGTGIAKTSDPWRQAVAGMRYIKSAYGDPQNAWNFHKSHGWYGDGSIFTGAQTIGVGERGPEAVIPLNERGADFIASIIAKTHAGNEARQGLVRGSTPMTGHTYYNYSIDRSTTFSGNITVQANDPNQFVAQLRARERARALTQPALGGRRV